MVGTQEAPKVETLRRSNPQPSQSKKRGAGRTCLRGAKEREFQIWGGCDSD
ncbi:unnamed protein product [Ixodes persulcatus]